MLVIFCLFFTILNLVSAQSVLPPKNPVGIANCGVSCFMNSTLQAFITMNLFAEFIQQERAAYKPESITQSLITILDLYNHSDEALSLDIMRPFYQKITSTFFRNNIRQEDATEFWDLLYLQITNKDLVASASKKKEIVDHIEKLIGMKEIESTIQESGETTDKELILSKLMIDIHNHEQVGYITRLQTGIVQNLFEDQGASTFTREPQGLYLITALKIFDEDASGQLIKIDAPIIIDEQINTTNGNYNCIAMVCHRGKTLSSGHYVAFVKRPSAWFLCDDQTVTNLGNFNQMTAKRRSENFDPYFLIFAKENYVPQPAASVQIPAALPRLDKTVVEKFSDDLNIIELLTR